MPGFRVWPPVIMAIAGDMGVSYRRSPSRQTALAKKNVAEQKKCLTREKTGDIKSPISNLTNVRFVAAIVWAVERQPKLFKSGFLFLFLKLIRFDRKSPHLDSDNLRTHSSPVSFLITEKVYLYTG